MENHSYQGVKAGEEDRERGNEMNPKGGGAGGGQDYPLPSQYKRKKRIREEKDPRGYTGKETQRGERA